MTETRIDEGVHDKSGNVETEEYGIVPWSTPDQIDLFHAGEVTTGDEWRGHLVTVNTAGSQAAAGIVVISLGIAAMLATVVFPLIRWRASAPA